VSGALFEVDAPSEQYADYVWKRMEDRGQYEEMALAAFDEYQRKSELGGSGEESRSPTCRTGLSPLSARKAKYVTDSQLAAAALTNVAEHAGSRVLQDSSEWAVVRNR
jgi:hypothetical protein